MPFGRRLFQRPVAAATATTTWNPADKGTGITLSGGNLSAVGDGADWWIVRSTTSHSSGKWLVGFRETTAAWSGSGMGFANGSQTLNSAVLGDTTNGCSYFANGGIRYGGVIASIANPTGGTVAITAIDIGAGKFWVFVPGSPGAWDGDPAAGTGGYSIPNVVGGAVYAALGRLSASPAIDGIFTGVAAAASISAPSGFSDWG